MADKEADSVAWVAWGTFRAFGETHAKTESGRTGAGKDIRVIGRYVTKWKERKGHLLDPSMITGVYDQAIETLVLGLGVEGAVECPPSVVESIEKHGIRDVRLHRTPEACEVYSRLLHEGRRVALLAHGTC